MELRGNKRSDHIDVRRVFVFPIYILERLCFCTNTFAKFGGHRCRDNIKFLLPIFLEKNNTYIGLANFLPISAEEKVRLRLDKLD